MFTRTSEDGKSFPSMVGGTISWKLLLKHIKTREKTNYRKMVNMMNAKIKLHSGNLCRRFNRGILLLLCNKRTGTISCVQCPLNDARR